MMACLPFPLVCSRLAEDLQQRECSCSIELRQSKRAFPASGRHVLGLSQSPRVACGCGSAGCRSRWPSQFAAIVDSDQLLQYDVAGGSADQSPLGFEVLPGFEEAAELLRRQSSTPVTSGPIAAARQLARETADEIPNFPDFPQVVRRQGSRPHPAKQAADAACTLFVDDQFAGAAGAIATGTARASLVQPPWPVSV